MDSPVQKPISVFIEQQFPSVYRELGPTFVRFVEVYFEWLEQSGNPVYISRRAPDYRDIDATVEDFIGHFKKTYLRNIPLETASNVRQLVKHSLDVYRSKGTPRGDDLLFRLVFGTGAEVYFPADDLFRLSDGKWKRPRYIEVSRQDNLEQFVGREITGVSSGARAFAEKLVRFSTKHRIVDVIFISAVFGSFSTGEFINFTSSPVAIDECPRIIGSLTTLDVVTGGEAFEVGDEVSVISDTGTRGRALVSEIQEETGLVDFELVDGGYGYTANSEVIVSEKVLFLNNPSCSNVALRPQYYSLFEQVYQNTALVNYISATGSFQDSDYVYTYFGNNSPKGTGRIIELVSTNGANGVVRMVTLSGNMQSSQFFTAANAVTANQSVVNGYYTTLATANVIAQSNVAIATVNALTGVFQQDEEFYQTDGTTELANGTVTGISGQIYELGDVVGQLSNTRPLIGRVSGAEADLDAVQIRVGVVDVSNTFLVDSRVPTVGPQGTTATVGAVGSGTGASFAITGLDFTEYVLLCTDVIGTYTSVQLNAMYGFPAMPTANLATIIGSALSFANTQVGRIASIGQINPGEAYTADPMVRVYEPLTYPYRKEDRVVAVTGVTGLFNEGDLVTQSSSGARGIVRTSNATHITLKRLSLFDRFANTVNATMYLVDSSTGAQANIIGNFLDDARRWTDIQGRYAGVNADIAANTTTATGSAKTLSILDSGLGFEDGQVATFTRDGTVIGTALAHLGTHGLGAGRYAQKGGFLSDQKKLFDGDYWQDFSYEIRSSVTLDKYKDMLRNVLHVSGTKAFAQLRWKQRVSVSLSARSANVTVL